MKNILVPFDNSKEAIIGLNTAVNFSIKHGGKINLVNFMLNETNSLLPVEASLDRMSLSSDQMLIKQSEHVLKRLDDAMMKYVPETKRGAYFSVLDSLSALWNEILNHCDPDLIIIGTSGTRNLSEFFWGNSTETMLRNSDVPVLAVSDNEDMRIERILLATDVGKTLPKKLIDLCCALYEDGAEVHFACIINVDLLSEKAVKNKIVLLAKEYGIDQYQIHVRSNMSIKGGILEIAEEIDSDLIMMKTYEKSPFWQLLQSSVAEDVVGSTDLPTMVEKVKRK